MRHKWNGLCRASFVVLLALAIAACGDDEDKNGQASTTQGSGAGTAGGSIAAGDRPPNITGAAATRALINQYYLFQPVASDPDGDQMVFSIQNRPTWAMFSPSTGRLTGTPTASHVGTFKGVTITVAAGSLSKTLQPFDIQVVGDGTSATTTPPPSTPTTPLNVPPTISGTPAPQALVGQAYTFTPSAADADGDALSFSIGNKPSWATFDTATGRLSGTPTAANVGTYSAIAITVTAGGQSTMLKPFDLQVVDNGSKSITLSWVPPTQNEDGTPLLNLAGYRIRYGQQSGSYAKAISVDNPGLTSYVVDGLVPSGYYFVISAYTASGTESNYSGEVFANLN